MQTKFGSCIGSERQKSLAACHVNHLQLLFNTLRFYLVVVAAADVNLPNLSRGLNQD
jgi:hypothetical protein